MRTVTRFAATLICRCSLCLSEVLPIILLDLLARVGFEAVLNRIGRTAVDSDDEDSIAEETAKIAAAAKEDERRVLAELVCVKPRDIHANMRGSLFCGFKIDWMDRVPGLQPWTGNVTTTKLLKKLQDAANEYGGDDDLWSMRVALQGTSGLDWTTSRDPIDVGFSTNGLGVSIYQRVAVEMLAIIGLQQIPLVSFASRSGGFLFDGCVWRIDLEQRVDGYYYRWPFEVKVVRFEEFAYQQLVAENERHEVLVEESL